MSSYWKAPQLWPGSTVFVIGGGPSLRDMDWGLLRPRRVIGCNDAYRLGPDVMDVCYFGDGEWFAQHWRDEVQPAVSKQHWLAAQGYSGDELKPFPGLKTFGGLVVTCARTEPVSIPPHIKRLDRRPQGIHEAPRVGWYLNTGASAINLAIIFGAKRVVLLGFDMTLGERDRTNWHPNLQHCPPHFRRKPSETHHDPRPLEIYDRMLGQFHIMAKDLRSARPDVEVVNANPESRLNEFPKVPREEALKL